MPNVRDLASADLRSIIEDEDGAGTPYVLINENGEYPVVGTYGDIGNLVDPITGEPISGRAIEATVTAQSILTAAGSPPARGWKARITGLNGQEATLFVQRNEPDNTIGLYRLTLGLQLQDKKNE